ncbi:MAG TPA: PRC-barrel domain containing protein [Methanophagales archaeon]|nr:PRC-barrel domain containing protein [Methanophagales archaeon]
MWKKRGKEDTEKVIAYLRSRLFPWNFIFEDVEEDSIEHFVPYAIQICEGKGINKKAMGDEVVKEAITMEVKEAVNDYLFEPNDREMIKMHGKFISIYPFAFSQCLVYTILYRLGLDMSDVVDLKAIGDLLGRDIQGMKEREIFIRDLISKNEKKAMKMFGKLILDKKIITAGGDYVGNVGNIIFDIDNGSVNGLIINHRKGTGLKKSQISMNDVRLNMYTKNIILKHSNYNMK